MKSNWSLEKFDRMKDVDSQSVRKNGVYAPSTNRTITANSGENRHTISLRCYLFISLCLCTVTGLYSYYRPFQSIACHVTELCRHNFQAVHVMI